jgi:SAM-dependent methyltransferase
VPLQFAADDAASYERLMGRWSRRLAGGFLDFAAVGNPATILDVGCGTGSLTLALAQAIADARITGIDLSPVLVDYARSRTSDPRLEFVQGDAVALPYDDQSFDATVSLLVLNFVPAADRAIREMVRVTKPGGVVAAAVWDFRGGLCHQRVFLDTAAAIDRRADELRAKLLSTPLLGPGELAAAWTEVGLRRVEQTELTIRLEFQSFADYWEPWLGGAGTVAPYVTSLDEATKASIVHHLRRAYLAGGAEDGPRSFAATAWAVRGVR